MQPLGALIHSAERGLEMSLTVLVSGVVITGVITPWARYQRWLTEVAMRAQYEGGRHSIPDLEIGPIPRSQAEEIRAKYDDELRQVGREPDEPLDFPQFVLRDAVVRSGLPAAWSAVPFIVIQTAHVGAFTPIAISEPDSGP